MTLKTSDNLIDNVIPIVAGGSALITAGVGVLKIGQYATCKITEETLPIVSAKTFYQQESNTYTSGDKEITEYWNVLYTNLTLKGIDGAFAVRGDWRGYRQAKMRFYKVYNNNKSKYNYTVIDHHFICGYR